MIKWRKFLWRCRHKKIRWRRYDQGHQIITIVTCLRCGEVLVEDTRGR